MSQRFIRCIHCGMPHEAKLAFCPATGLHIERSSGKTRAALPRPMTPPLPMMPAAFATPPANPVARRSPPAKSDRLVGQTLGGRYVIRKVLGEGGMGTVYEAEYAAIGRAVAVKVLHPHQAMKKDAVRRFRREARAAAAIGHPNICEVYDFGTHADASPYLVMELLAGETLADRIACEGSLPFDEIVNTLIQVLSGLVAAHDRGIVHRDIKPENVFLAKQSGRSVVVKLLDFGVSKMIAPLFEPDDADLTRAGMVMGTPYYLSPEQARGDRDLDGRVDLYACGVILYEGLTGRRPFAAPNYNQLLLQILSAEPVPARTRRPALPAEFDGILEKAMARNRDRRYPSALEFQRDLKKVRERRGWRNADPAAVQSLPPPWAAEPHTDSIDIPIVVSVSESSLPHDDEDDSSDSLDDPTERHGEFPTSKRPDDPDPNSDDDPTVRMKPA